MSSTPALIRTRTGAAGEAATENLQSIRDALRRRLKTEVTFKLVRTRVFLRTGIDLDSILPAQNHDAVVVAKVLGALRECGHVLS